MKKTYESPLAEKIQFSYSEQLTASAEDIGGAENENGSGSGNNGNLDLEDVVERSFNIFGSDECESCESAFNWFS